MKRLLFCALLLMSGCGRNADTVTVTIPKDMAAPAPTPPLNPGVVVVVNSFQPMTEGITAGDPRFNTPQLPATGKTFLIANVRATYEGSGDCKVSSNEFRLKSNGRIYDSKVFLGSQMSIPLIDGHLTKGGTVTGNVVFEVESSVQSGEVEYRRNWLDFGA